MDTKLYSSFVILLPVDKMLYSLEGALAILHPYSAIAILHPYSVIAGLHPYSDIASCLTSV